MTTSAYRTFLHHVAAFGLVGLASIYPTRRFLSWRSSVRRGEAPVVESATLNTIRTFLHIELAAVLLIILCAALMARGIGTFA